MYELFTDRARKVLQLANQEAKRFSHEYVGTEHILLGVIAEGSGVASNVLKNLGIDINRVRREVEAIVLPGPDMGITELKLPQTPRAKRALQLAVAEAKRLQHNYVGTEHLLLGLIHEGEGIGAQVLLNLGLRAAVICNEVLRLMGTPTACPEHVPLQTADQPARVAKAIHGLGDILEVFQRMRAEAIASNDFERVAALRDQKDKLNHVMKVLLSIRHCVPISPEEVSADLNVLCDVAQTAEDGWSTHQFEIHLSLSTQDADSRDLTILSAFQERLAKGFGRVITFRHLSEDARERQGTAPQSEAIHWWVFARHKPGAIAFLRQFREDLMRTTGFDNVVVLCRDVTII